MATPPTVTANGTSAPAGQTTSYLRNALSTFFRESGGTYSGGSILKYKSAVIWTSGGNFGDSAGGQVNWWRVRFIADANMVTFRVSGTTLRYRFIVDGQYVDTTGSLTTNTSGNGSEYISLDFTSAGGRAVREIILEGQPGCGFLGVYVGATERCFQAPEAPFCTVSLGDSYVYGTNATALGDGMDAHMADRLGWNNHMNSGSGGTGWVLGSSAYTFLQRIQNGDLALNGTPNLICLQGSGNDKNSSGATVTANVTTALQLIRLTYPLAPVLVFGVWPASNFSGGTLSVTANEAAVQAGVTGYGTDPMVQFIPINGAVGGAPLSGSGFVGGTTGSGNADVDMFDTTHPNSVGGAAFGRWKADQAYRALLNIAAAMA
jgi:lysophospholipase L1-like esterase